MELERFMEPERFVELERFMEPERFVELGAGEVRGAGNEMLDSYAPKARK